MALDRAWFNALVDDAGDGVSGSVWDKADIKALLDSVDAEIARLDGGLNACLLSTNAPISWGSGVWASVGFTAEIYDPLNLHAPSDFSARIAVAGLYSINALVTWPPSAAGSRGTGLYLNGNWAGLITFDKAFDGGGSIGPTSRNTSVHYLEVGTTVGLQLYQDSGVAQVIPVSGVRLEIYKL